MCLFERPKTNLNSSFYFNHSAMEKERPISQPTEKISTFGELNPTSFGGSSGDQFGFRQFGGNQRQGDNNAPQPGFGQLASSSYQPSTSDYGNEIISMSSVFYNHIKGTEEGHQYMSDKQLYKVNAMINQAEKDTRAAASNSALASEPFSLQSPPQDQELRGLFNSCGYSPNAFGQQYQQVNFD